MLRGATHDPIKLRRGLSKHYASRSQSFGSLELVLLLGESAEVLAKAPHRQRGLHDEESGACMPPESPMQGDSVSGAPSLRRFSLGAEADALPASASGSLASAWSSSVSAEEVCGQFIRALRVSSAHHHGNAGGSPRLLRAAHSTTLTRLASRGDGPQSPLQRHAASQPSGSLQPMLTEE